MIFIVFFGIFFFANLLKEGFWSTDDPYYHAKHSALIAQTGDLTLVKPWAEFHFLNYAPNDPWWGFHLLQAVFIYFFGIFLGVKISSAILAGLFFAVFYFILKKFSIRYPFVWTCLVFVSSSYFLFRISMERPQVLGMIILPLFSYLLVHPVRNSNRVLNPVRDLSLSGVNAAGIIPKPNPDAGQWSIISNGVKKKYYLMFCLAVIFTIFYHLFLSLFFLIFFYGLAEYYQERKVSLKPFIFTGLGVLAGVLLHPDSLNYLFVVFVSFAEILYLKFAGVDLGVGGELYPSPMSDFIFSNFLIFIPFCLAIVLFLAVKQINKNREIIFYFLVSVFWFSTSLIIIRAVDFWVPFGWLFVALVFKEFSQSEEWLRIKNIFRRHFNLKVTAFFFFCFVLSVSLFNITEIFFIGIWEDNQTSVDRYIAEANDWLKKNTPAGSIIFFDNWSFWPMMFFYNDHNRYLAGMDPTFLYEYDHQLFWIWKNISYYALYCDKPEICLEIAPRDNIKLIKSAVREKFRSDYILLMNKPERPLTELLSIDKKDFTKVFNNNRVSIYKIIP